MNKNSSKQFNKRKMIKIYFYNIGGNIDCMYSLDSKNLIKLFVAQKVMRFKYTY